MLLPVQTVGLAGVKVPAIVGAVTTISATAEKVGDGVGTAVDKTKDAVKAGAEKTGEAFEKVGEKIKEIGK